MAINRVALLSNMKEGIDALKIHPLRTMLSILGIIVGSASLVATMAVSDGVMDFARGKIEQQTSVQVITIGSRTSEYRRGEWLPITDYPVFSMADVDAARDQIGGAEAITMVLSGSARVRHRGAEQQSKVILGTEELPNFGTVRLAAGRFFSAVEASRNAPVAVVNYALARELVAGRDPLQLTGEQIVVAGKVRQVIGVLERDQYEEPKNPDFILYAPIRAASALLQRPPSGRFTPSLQIKAPTVEAVTVLRDAAMNWLATRYTRWESRIRVTVGLEMLAQVEQGILLAKLFLGALVGISLLVGGIGIMNVLLASVTERTREIGIRKAIGARPADIQAQFLTESVAIAVAGTGIGLVTGLVLSLIVTAVFRYFIGAPVFPVLSINTILIAIASSSIVGLVFGTYPARRAARLAPIQAIAHE